MLGDAVVLELINFVELLSLATQDLPLLYFASCLLYSWGTY